MPNPTDPKELARYRRVLSESYTIGEAAKRVGMGRDALAQAFLRRGERASDLLKKDARPKTLPPPSDPADAYRVRKSEKDTRAELARVVELLRVERDKNAFLDRLKKEYRPPAILRRERASGLRECTALVLASDWHVEETVDPRKVQGRNEYNLTIAEDRIRRFFQGIIDLIEHHRASKKLVIRDLILALMGDLITGYIHEELQEMNELSPIETALWLTPRIRDGIATLLDTLQLESITLPCDEGNHGRTTQRLRIATGPENSFEYGIYCQLARDFAKEKRVRFDTTPANDHYVRVYDYTLHTTHGTNVGYQGGIGGLSIPLNKSIAAWNTDIPATWHAIGHYHTALDLGPGIVNGSMIGWAPYAKFIKATYNPRDLSQHFSLIDSKRGRCHSTPIWVAKRVA